MEIDRAASGFADRGAIYQGFYETPRCPENCTINTYYDPDNHVCLSCPENTYRDCIGAVDCTALSAMPTTTTPAPLCDGETSPFFHAGNTLCVPKEIHPVGELTELQKCGDECTFWLDTNKMMFKTGGAGPQGALMWSLQQVPTGPTGASGEKKEKNVVFIGTCCSNHCTRGCIKPKS